jgi:hypothetical protein
MNIFERVKALNLPAGSFVVVGGGTLVALELIAWDDDVDICVAPEIFAQLHAKEWRQDTFAGKPVLKHDVYDVGIGFGQWSLDELLSDAQIIQDIPFISLGKLLEWKRQMGRPKDLRHIALVEAHLHC